MDVKLNKNKMDNLVKNEKELKNLGFKKVWLDDKSGYWFEKKFKILEFKGRFYYDGKFSTIDVVNNLDTYEITIWSGTYKKLIEKVKKYNKKFTKKTLSIK